MTRLASLLTAAVLLFAWGQPAWGQCPNCPNGGCRITPAVAPAPGGVVALDNGKTYYQHPDGIFRETPAGKLCDCCKPQCTCEPGNKNPDCVCYPCKCHPTAAPQPVPMPAFFTDTHGYTYTLIGGTYWQTGPRVIGAVPTSYPSCPGVLGTKPQAFRLQPTCPNCQR